MNGAQLLLSSLHLCLDLQALLSAPAVDDPQDAVVAQQTKIKEHSSQNSEGTASLSEDGVTKLFGKERFVRIRGLSFGVTPSQLGVLMAHSKKVSALENELTRLQRSVQELTDLVMTIARRGNLMNDLVPPCGNTHQV